MKTLRNVFFVVLLFSTQLMLAQVSKIYVLAGLLNVSLTTYTVEGQPTTPTLEFGYTDRGGIAVDAGGRIHITSFGQPYSTYLPDGTLTTPMPRFAAGTFGISITPDGLIYLLSAGPEAGGTINIFTPDGKKTNFILTPRQNVPHFAVAPNGNIAIVSQMTHTLKIFDRQGQQLGATITAGINTPFAVAIGPDGKIYVANLLNVTSYTPDGKQTPVTLERNFPTGPGLPKAVAVDAAGNVYVGYTQGVVAIFDPRGALIRAITTPKTIYAIAVH